MHAKSGDIAPWKLQIVSAWKKLISVLHHSSSSIALNFYIFNHFITTRWETVCSIASFCNKNLILNTSLFKKQMQDQHYSDSPSVCTLRTARWRGTPKHACSPQCHSHPEKERDAYNNKQCWLRAYCIAVQQYTIMFMPVVFQYMRWQLTILHLSRINWKAK